MHIKEVLESIAIIGYGLEGRSMCSYLLNNGYLDITILDENSIKLEAEHKAKGVKLKQGKDYLDGIEKFHTIFRSPGIHPKYLKKHNRVSSVISFFMNNCTSKVIGVTGTKGKGTTSSLLKSIIEHSGESVYLGGNIGIPPTDFIHPLHKNDLVVLELSSFQLMDTTKSPHIAIMLKTTEDHLDYHEDRDEYVEAKENIFRHQTEDDIAILYDKNLHSALRTMKTKNIYLYSNTKELTSPGAFIRNNTIIFIDQLGNEEEVYNLKNLKLIGSHNFENAMAALIAAKLLNIPNSHIKEVLDTFSGLPSRLEDIGSVNDIRFINDSFSTNPQTCIAAIKSFDKPIHLFLGGSEKNANFDELINTIKNTINIKGIYIMGETQKRMNKLFKAQGIHPNQVRRLREGVEMAFFNAKKDDIILMSPACASFGMFKNYKERAEVFKDIYKDIKERS
jgi:UDP-N-acetylmuramoylalanine--D-glutamate ligase